ncbi:MAG: para-aminobenzoate synthetase component [Clostridia bacterium]|jgi:anthranilate synthase/aminodeoxychorismate synthase-like glutamine amidotransferase|nr:para-aminobenzoate synthetase component [Clostridia bacterium]
MIDNYDSFVYNLVQYLGDLGYDALVYRNDKITIERIKELKPEAIILSPGPCTPNEAGISLELVKEFAPTIPILGVCLGHQTIGQAFRGKVTRADRLMHGKTSTIMHDNKTIFHGLKNPLTVTRYHSLILREEDLPNCFEISAWTDQGEIMAIRHKEYPVEGVQFHPEAILTEEGHNLLENFLKMRVRKGAREIREVQGSEALSSGTRHLVS